MSRVKRPSHSTVAAYLALFIALGGGSFAIAALNKKDKKTVKNIANTEITKRAPGLAVASANSANSANSADTAGNADTAGDANTLDGQAASAFVQPGSEAWQPMTLNDGSLFGTVAVHEFCYWTPAFQGPGFNATAPAYFRDSAGVVHLKGTVAAHDGDQGDAVSCGDPAPLDRTITLLPAGYRTGSENWAFPALSDNTLGRISVLGDVVRIEDQLPTFVHAKVYVSLDGLSFRCGPSGANGCP